MCECNLRSYRSQTVEQLANTKYMYVYALNYRSPFRESRMNERGGERGRVKGRERKVEGKIAYDEIKCRVQTGGNELKLMEINRTTEGEAGLKAGEERTGCRE